MNNFNILEKTNMIYIIILIFVICASIHLYKINNNNNNNNNNNSKSSFMDITENQNIGPTFTINVPSSKQVIFNDSGVESTLYNILENKADQKDLLLTNNAINNAMPELSIIAYGGPLPPTGWQLCNGEPMKYSGSTEKLDPRETDRFGSLWMVSGLFTAPDLRGRFILGAGKGNNLLDRPVNQTGGEETHKLLESEMPSHSHNDPWVMRPHDNYVDRQFAYGHGSANARYGSHNESKGGDTPHENMPPFWVLTYIIKQPKK
jgi:microcystin-dependent protein